MPEKIFYTKLYAFQDELLEIVRAQNVDFYLTGGTALSRAYLNHRYSDDIFNGRMNSLVEKKMSQQ